ncbi:MAG TPA: hypothetical protein VKX40_11085 [Aequorivita sp.]|nr:hypothetical protein [Aequorivita sp.]
MDKIIVSDSSCLIFLDKLGLLHLLKEFYREINVTPEVIMEWGQIAMGFRISDVLLKKVVDSSNLK